MAKQDCLPTRVFGGDFQQHLFLGCSIQNINASVGWNEQQSTVEVNLVQDPCKASADHPKVYWDQNLQRRTTTAADPGFTFPNVGSPVYLRVENWEFCGLIQAYEQTNNDSGNPTFRVTLVDPRIVLQGTQVIIGDYAGDVLGTPNVINAYGFAESYGQICPLRNVLGAYFGSPAGAFGGASLNDNGMRWNILKEAVLQLTSSIPPQSGMFSSLGRLIYIGSNTPGYGSFKYDFLDVTVPLNFPQQTAYQSVYYVDLTEIPNAPAYYRIAGTSISLLDLISTVCEDAGCDYYIELVPLFMGGTIIKVIKVRVVVRGSQPILGQISEFINDAGNVISKTVGVELRNETTSQIIIGGQVESIYQADEAALLEDGLIDENEPVIIPFWGLDRDKNIIPTEYDSDGKLNFTVDLTQLNTLLYQPLNIDTAKITEYELQAALTGQDAWVAIASSLPSDLGNELQIAGVLDSQRILGVLNNIGFPHHLIVPGKNAGGGVINFDDLKAESEKLKDIETIYNFVLNYARDFYGKKYLVRMPYSCSRIDDESFQTQSSERPSDGGWSEEKQVIGLDNPTLTDMFKDDAGRLGPFVRFDDAKNSIEVSNIAEEDYLLIEGEESDTLFLRASNVFEEFVFEDYSIRFNPHAVVELAVPILERLDAEDVNRTKLFASKFFTVINNARNALGLGAPGPAPNMNDVLKNTGNSLLHLGINSNFKKPDAIAVPIHSESLTYGPWVAAGPVGLTNIEKDDGLVPWEYGSLASMNLAGNQKVTQGVTYMQVAEQGSLTIPGYPQLSLGAELRSGGNDVIENRTITSNNPSTAIWGHTTEKGKWDASSGTAPSAKPKNGDFYRISKSGNTVLSGNSTWSKNNVVVFRNGKWEHQASPLIVYITLTGAPWFGTFGPNITGISIDIGESGLTTTYTFRTYTPKFGRFSKRNADRLQEYSKIINSVTKQARLAALSQLKIQTNRANAQSPLMSNRLGNPFSVFAASPPGVLIGQTVTTEAGKKSTAVQVIKHNELVTEIEKYESKALMSLDGLLRPVSKSGSGGLPRYSQYSAGCLSANPVRPEPPLDAYGPTGISQQQLDPWQDGHDIDILARGTEIPNNLSIPLDSYASDYRGLALKGPLLLQQPGFDIQGKPIPNAVDTESDAENGTFAANGLKDAFLSNYLSKPNTWPVAPVDLRFDRQRGVWTAPQPYRMVRCVLNDDLDSGGTEAEIIDGNSVEDDTGSVIDKIITVWPMSSKQTAKAGDVIMCEYDSVGCKYRVVSVPNKQENSGQVFIGKATASSTSNHLIGYDVVNVVRCMNFAGDEVDPRTEDVVRLMKHHTSEPDHNLSVCHMHDIREGDMLLYVGVDETIGSGNPTTVYAAISDYSREQSIFFGEAQQDSTGPNFPDFQVKIKTGDGAVGNVPVKNRLNQPLLAGDCCYVYRHKVLFQSIDPEFWLIQAQFTPTCIVSDIVIATDDFPIQGSENCNTDSSGSDSQFFDSENAFTQYLNFSVRDITMYVESAYLLNDWSESQTYMRMIIDYDVQTQCCSASTRGQTMDLVCGAYELAMQDFEVHNHCTASDNTAWIRHSQGLGYNCDPTDVTFD